LNDHHHGTHCEAVTHAKVKLCTYALL